ncbi:MAG TPA: HTTM domain-containing protein [Verrucomicrobiae bacterium]|nr:HTTM domain-containing protein [Verrucomicrobiae bacterium]
MKITLTSHPFADWFFPLVTIRALKIFRIALGIVTLCAIGVWLPHLEAFFSSQGYVTASYIFDVTLYSHLSVFFLYDAPWFVYTVYGLMVLSTFAMIFGIGGRLSAIFTYLLFISFASRFPLVFYGAIDAIHSFLFFNILHPADAYSPWGKGGIKERSRLVPAWSMRMVQLTLCLVYFYAACQKIRVGTWWNGTEILNSLSTRFGAFNFYWLVKYPVIVNFMTYFSWFSEVSFPFLVFNPVTRRFALLMIVSMHIGIGLMMNASFFTPIMLAGLACFIAPEDELRVAELWHKYTRRFGTGIQRSVAARRKTA